MLFRIALVIVFTTVGAVAQAHCLDTQTVLESLSGFGDFGLSRHLFKKPRPFPRRPPPKQVSQDPGFRNPPNLIMLGAGEGIDNYHECSMKRAMCSGPSWGMEH